MGPLTPHLDFDGAGQAHPADAGLIRPSPGGWGRNMFLSETLWGFQPQAPAYFSLVGKVGKSTLRRGTLSIVSPS